MAKKEWQDAKRRCRAIEVIHKNERMRFTLAQFADWPLTEGFVQRLLDLFVAQGTLGVRPKNSYIPGRRKFELKSAVSIPCRCSQNDFVARHRENCPSPIHYGCCPRQTCPHFCPHLGKTSSGRPSSAGHAQCR